MRRACSQNSGKRSTSIGVRLRRSWRRTWALTCSASSEVPPIARKLACRWMADAGRHLFQMPASASSAWLRQRVSARASACACSSTRAASAARSSLPFRLSGHRCIAMKRFGTAGNGKRSPRNSATASLVGAPPPMPLKQATRCCDSALSPRISTAASPTPGHERSRVSTSSSSTRCPWIFTCRSTRPRNSNAPSARRCTRSPVRYQRRPSRTMNFCALSSGSLR